ncbi:MAG: hypothetical protein J6A01_13010 [Proteobacteria bacterium]|nr:hypothetical protein [Pseudomonadota bacterium]
MKSLAFFNHLSTLTIVACICMGCGASQVKVPEGTTPAEKQPESAEAAENPKVTQTPAESGQIQAKETELADSGNVQVPAENAHEAVVESSEDNVEIANAPKLDLIYCEVKIDQNSSLYNAQAAGPTLEEARDNAVDEACAIPCAEELAHGQISEDEADKQLSSCTEHCVSDTIVLAVSCSMGDQVIYTEGAWNQTDEETQDSSRKNQEQE